MVFCKHHRTPRCARTSVAWSFEDLGSRPIVFIRFNPDAYKRDDIAFKSSFIYLKSGLCKVRDAKEFNSRCGVLMDAIHEQLRRTFEENRMPDKTIEVIKLFYDS